MMAGIVALTLRFGPMLAKNLPIDAMRSERGQLKNPKSYVAAIFF